MATNEIEKKNRFENTQNAISCLKCYTTEAGNMFPNYKTRKYFTQFWLKIFWQLIAKDKVK